LDDWKEVANEVTGSAVPSGHYIPEEIPEILLEEVRTFFN
jgi:haloacetate dehalogenase